MLAKCLILLCNKQDVKKNLQDCITQATAKRFGLWAAFQLVEPKNASKPGRSPESHVWQKRSKVTFDGEFLLTAQYTYTNNPMR